MAATLPRLRQVALVARDLEAARAALEHDLGVADPFADPGVGEFGLGNAVYEIGDTFLEVVSPVRDGTTAGRYLDRRGGDSGYMALVQVADTGAARRRVTERGMRIVWQLDLDDISGTHVHPRDTPGAIVSFDTPAPPESWRWGGPRWVGGAPADRTPGRGIVGLTVEVADPAGAAAAWAAVAGVAADGTTVALGDGTVRFVARRGATRRSSPSTSRASIAPRPCAACGSNRPTNASRRRRRRSTA